MLLLFEIVQSTAVALKPWLHKAAKGSADIREAGEVEEAEKGYRWKQNTVPALELIAANN